MSTSERRTEELTDRLLLDAKALALLQGSDERLRALLQAKLIESDDESLRRFAEAMRPTGPPKSGRLVIMALGEMVLASILVIAGAAVILPTLVGISTPAGLIQYFAERVYGTLGSSFLTPYVPLMEFVLGAVLMLSAFYTLRHAALSLREAGLAIEPGER